MKRELEKEKLKGAVFAADGDYGSTEISPKNTISALISSTTRRTPMDEAHTE